MCTINCCSLSSAAPPACVRQAEVMFLIGGSTQEAFDSSLTFVRDIASMLAIGSTSTRVGVVTHTTNADLAITLDRANSNSELDAILAGLFDTPGPADLDSAITLAHSELNSIGRVGVAKFIFVITNQPSDNMVLTLRSASAARDDDIHLVAIGQGSGVNQAELNQIADAPDHVFSASSSDLPSLRALTTQVLDVICTLR